MSYVLSSVRWCSTVSMNCAILILSTLMRQKLTGLAALCFDEGCAALRPRPCRCPGKRCSNCLRHMRFTEQAMQLCQAAAQAMQLCDCEGHAALQRNSGTGAAVGCLPNARHLAAFAGLSSCFRGLEAVRFRDDMCPASAVR